MRIPRGVRNKASMERFLVDKYKEKGIDKQDPFKIKRPERRKPQSYQRAVAKRQILTSKEKRDLVQPLGRDGLVNPHFEKIYGHNPYKGVKRDKNRR